MKPPQIDVCEWCGCSFQQSGRGAPRKTCGKEHQRLRDNANGAVRSKRKRDAMSPGEKIAKSRDQYAKRTPEQLERNRQRNRARYIKADPVETARLRALNRASHLRRKAEMTDEERAERRVKRNEYQRRKAAMRTPEQIAAKAERARADHRKRHDDARRFRMLMGTP